MLCLPEEHYIRASTSCRLARALAGQGRAVDARQLLEPAVTNFAGGAQPSTRYQIECRRALVGVDERLGLEALASTQAAALAELVREKPRSPS